MIASVVKKICVVDCRSLEVRKFREADFQGKVLNQTYVKMKTRGRKGRRLQREKLVRLSAHHKKKKPENEKDAGCSAHSCTAARISHFQDAHCSVKNSALKRASVRKKNRDRKNAGIHALQRVSRIFKTRVAA